MINFIAGFIGGMAISFFIVILLIRKVNNKVNLK